MATSPTARTLAKCRSLGWRACVVEKWIQATKQRKDVFGFGDVLALDGQPGSLLIQACRGADTAARETKIINECTAAATEWLRAGNRIEVWGWRKAGPRGKRKLWTLKRSAVCIVPTSAGERLCAMRIEIGGEHGQPHPPTTEEEASPPQPC